MKYGIFDTQLGVWLMHKPVFRKGRLVSADWQQLPCHPFLSLTNAEESLDKFGRGRYTIVSELGKAPEVQQRSLFEDQT